MSFQQKLQRGELVLTVELSPPKGSDPYAMLAHAKKLQGRVDAINIPDCQLAMLKMSAMAAAKLIQDTTGIEAIWQLTCRDRNLIALQSDLLGGYALGLRNVLALTGDPVQIGDQRDLARQVFHLESVRLLDLIQKLNQDQDAVGNALRHQGTRFLVGAALNPFKLSNRAQQLRLRQKIERGVAFFQTQPVYASEPIEEAKALLRGIAQEVGCAPPKILAGLIPPKSAQAARRMNATIVGVSIPENFIHLLERAQNPAVESIAFCADLVASLHGVADGFHLMPVGMVAYLERLLEACEFKPFVDTPACVVEAPILG